jgi:hypothetical protein
MAPGIRGEGPFTGSPTPNICPGCGDRLFSIEPGLLKCEICGAEINLAKAEKVDEDAAVLTLRDGWGGQDIEEVPARPAQVPSVFSGRQRRKTGAFQVQV